MEELLFLAAFFGFSIASLSDLKTREVPDYLSYFLIILGLLYRIVWSFSLPLDAIFPVILMPLVFSVIFGLASYILYKSGQWGGGDVKLLVAAAWLVGAFPSKDFFFLSFFMNLIIFGTLYTIFYTIVKGIGRGIHKGKSALLILGFFIGLLVMNYLESLPAYLSFLIPVTVAAAFGIPYFKEAEDKCFIKAVPVSKLTEGDWLVQGVRGVPKRGEGLTMKDIEKIRKMKISRVRIKEGVPFIPAFLISLILTWSGIYILPVTW